MRLDSPEALGARCASCPFNGRRVVASINANKVAPYKARFVVLGDYPGFRETIEGEPLAGPAGDLFDKQLAYWSETRRDVFITNAMLCPRRATDVASDIKKAMRACRPRVRTELQKILQATDRPVKVLVLGKYALATLTGKDKLFSWMGPPSVDDVTVMDGRTDDPRWRPKKGAKQVASVTEHSVGYLATFNPSFIMRARQYSPVMLKHVGRFLAWQQGKLPAWEWPHEVWQPGQEMLDVLRMFAAHPERRIGSDTETDGLHDPITHWHKKTKHILRLLNVGFANEHVGVSVPWSLIQNSKDSLHQQIKEVTQTLLRKHPNRGYQNNFYDYPVERMLALDGGAPAWAADDTLVAHSIIVPEWSHKLGFQACVDFAAPRWKENFRMGGDLAGKRYARATMEDRGVYNIRDCVLTKMLMDQHERRLATEVHNGAELYGQMMRLQRVAIGMRMHGFTVSTKARAAMRAALRDEWRKNKEVIFTALRALDLAPSALKLNHSSGLIKIFCESKLALEPLAYTPTGKPKFDIGVMLAIAKGPNQLAAKLARHLILDRKLEKLLATHLDYLPRSLEFDGDVSARTVVINEAVHPTWNPSTAKTGRWGAKSPALMTVTEGKTLELPGIQIRLPNLRKMYTGKRRKLPYLLSVPVGAE
jgi:uracil-DNA glycosylase family 4